MPRSLLAAISATGPATAGVSAAAASGPATAGVSGAAAGGEGASEAGDDATAVPAADDATPEPAADDATPEPDADDGAHMQAPPWSSRTWTGMGTSPYFPGVHFAVHGSNAQTCTRIETPSTNAHPETPVLLMVGFVGVCSHLTVRV